MNYLSRKGYVLLIVLVFLQIFSLVALFALTQAAQLLRRENARWQSDEYARQANKWMARVIAGGAIDSGACAIPITPVSILANRPVSWWRVNTCSANLSKISYYYAIESIGSDACAIIWHSPENQTQVAYYYRVSILMEPGDGVARANWLIQDTVIKPVDREKECDQETHVVYAGQQARRTLYLVPQELIARALNGMRMTSVAKLSMGANV